MRYQWNGEDMTTDVVSALAAGLTGYLGTYMSLNGKANYAFWADIIGGVGGITAKNYVGSPLAHEVLEAVGYGSFAGLGAWAAAVMAKKDNIPVWRPQTQKTASVIAPVSYDFPPPAPVAVPVAVPAAAPVPAAESEGNWEFEY